MVTDEGRVKVLDFGLAKLVGSEGAARAGTELTQQGVIMGTLPYMSPEQIEGKDVDFRADIFSLGVLLHEMATGARPFTGDNAPALMYSILQETPKAVTDLRSDHPPHLNDIVGRCLEKIAEQTLRHLPRACTTISMPCAKARHLRPRRFGLSPTTPSPCCRSRT